MSTPERKPPIPRKRRVAGVNRSKQYDLNGTIVLVNDDKIYLLANMQEDGADLLADMQTILRAINMRLKRKHGYRIVIDKNVMKTQFYPNTRAEIEKAIQVRFKVIPL